MLVRVSHENNERVNSDIDKSLSNDVIESVIPDYQLTYSDYNSERYPTRVVDIILSDRLWS
jgi:hypothetical protein